jgi:DNA helicase II / ATP-dependent DNA helicase PcrA
MKHESDSDDLTPQQQAAVEHVDGPLLVLAGPGSGKTRVVTRRIAHLISTAGVPPWNVLAITFTNKAAGEMSERVRALLPGRRVWVSTFHRFCARLLRQYGEAVGLKPNFSILDTADQKQMMRLVMESLDYSTTHFPPAKLLWRISNLKNDLITPETFNEREEFVGDSLEAAIRRAYPEYQRTLLEANSVDFDDLLMHTATLLSENPELREQLDERYRYILVDEYQDTNLAQYRIVTALSQVHPHLCATGDPDQSIYGWRGARIDNILRFERDFPQTKVIRLEQNFRSTQAILRSADNLIVQNKQRKHKQLLTDKEEGHPVRLLCFEDSEREADAIALKIRELVEQEGYRYHQFALFYRVNALSRQLETALRRHRVPFQVAAGLAFYDRAEVKDLLAYLRLIENPADRASFLRIVNKPLRGLGKTSQDRLIRHADAHRLTLMEAAARAEEVPQLTKQAVTRFRRFAEMMERFSLADSGSVSDLLRRVVESTHYTAGWEESESEKDRQKLANVHELISVAGEYDQSCENDPESDGPPRAVAPNESREGPTLQGFLEQTALVNEVDSLDPEAGQATLMTLHAAKGLEFPVVFIVGVEQGLIPHQRSVKSANPHEVEEERRLLFVGMTRAQEQLYLTYSYWRPIHGQMSVTIYSDFLTELECERVDWPSAEGQGARDEGQGPRAERQGTGSERHSPSALDPQPLTLTTAAHLLNGEHVPVEIPVGYQVGMPVRHPKYGRGEVIQVGGSGRNRTVTVRFEREHREQSFIAHKAPLQPIGSA